VVRVYHGIFFNTDMVVTPIVWRLVSGIRTHRIVTLCLNHLKHQFWGSCSPSTVGITTIVYDFAVV